MGILIRALTALACILPFSQAAAVSEDRPDVLLIIVDDLGWHDVGFTGGGSHETPRIDAFAQGATVFEHAYADAPNCAPTRASILTGLAPPRHGIITVGTSKRGKAENRRLEPVPNRTRMDTSVPTLATLLQAEGWRTIHVGKFHVGMDPTEYGFTDNVAGTSAGHPKSYFSPYRNKALPDGPDGEYLTDRLVTETIAFLESGDERPLFIQLSFYSVHTPYQARKDLLALMRERMPDARGTSQKYAAMVRSVDDGIGRVLDALEARDRPAMVIFVSDNGGSWPQADNGSLRGSKGMLYEGGIRVPLAIDWPGDDAPAREAMPVLTRDLTPTILDVAGIAREGIDMDGRSLSPIANKVKVESRPLHWHFPAYLEAYGGMKATWRTTPVAAVRDGRFKMLEFFEDGRIELYDLEQDPSETTNVAEHEPETVDRLKAEMVRWRLECKAALPRPLEEEVEGSTESGDQPAESAS